MTHRGACQPLVRQTTPGPCDHLPCPIFRRLALPTAQDGLVHQPTRPVVRRRGARAQSSRVRTGSRALRCHGSPHNRVGSIDRRKSYRVWCPAPGYLSSRHAHPCYLRTPARTPSVLRCSLELKPWTQVRLTRSSAPAWPRPAPKASSSVVLKSSCCSPQRTAPLLCALPPACTSKRPSILPVHARCGSGGRSPRQRYRVVTRERYRRVTSARGRPLVPLSKRGLQLLARTLRVVARSCYVSATSTGWL